VAQEPIATPAVRLDSAQTVVIGASLVVASGAGEAYDLAGVGYGVAAHVGIEWATVDELRAVVTLTRHDDELSDEDMTVFEVRAEPTWRLELGAARLRAGPHVAWTLVRGDRLRDLSALGVGGILGAQLCVANRLRVEVGVAATLSAFGRPAGSPDPDGSANGALRTLQLGLVYELP
jgi:hypothetical protein